MSFTPLRKKKPDTDTKVRALQADHQTVLPAAVVQYGNRLAGAVAPQDHEAKEQI